MASITVLSKANQALSGSSAALDTSAYEVMRLTLSFTVQEGNEKPTLHFWVEGSNDLVNWQVLYEREFAKASVGGPNMFPLQNTYDLPPLPAPANTRIRWNYSAGSISFGLSGTAQ